MMRKWKKQLDDGKVPVAEWVQALVMPEDIREEMHGMADAWAHPDVTVDLLITFNHMYEMRHPHFCSGALIALKNGTVIHGRNMDYSFDFSTARKQYNWQDITFEAIFVRGGEPFIDSVQWLGHFGIHTAQRIGEWAFEQNTRAYNNKQE